MSLIRYCPSADPIGQRLTFERVSRTMIGVVAGGSTLVMNCDVSTDGKTWTPTFEGKANETNR